MTLGNGRSPLWRVAAFFAVTGLPPLDFASKFLPIAYKKFCDIVTVSEGREMDAGFPFVALPDSSSSDSDVLETFLPQLSDAMRALIQPLTFSAFDEMLDDNLCLAHVALIRSRLGVAESPHIPVSVQYLINGIDAWMSSRSTDENMKLVLACGVSPAAVQEGLTLSPTAMIDFVIDVVFPEDGIWQTILNVGERHDDVESVSKADPSPVCTDWIAELVTTTLSGVQIMEVFIKSFFDIKWLDTAFLPQLQLEGGGNRHNPTPANQPHSAHSAVERDSSSVECAATPDAEDDGTETDVFLTADNLQTVLLTTPELVPRPVLLAHRKPLTSEHITEFEIERHYTIPELRVAVKGLVAAAEAKAGASSVVEKLQAVTAAISWKGKKSEVAKSLFLQLPVLRKLFTDLGVVSSNDVRVVASAVIDVDAISVSSPLASPPAEVSESESQRNTQLDRVLEFITLKAISDKAAVRQLVEVSNRSELDAVAARYVTLCDDQQKDVAVKKMKTKMDVAKFIVQHVSRSGQ